MNWLMGLGRLGLILEEQVQRPGGGSELALERVESSLCGQNRVSVVVGGEVIVNGE